MWHDELAELTTVDEVWQVRREALANGDAELAEAARRRLAELTPDNQRAVPPGQAKHPMGLGPRLALVVGVGAIFGLVTALGFVTIGWGDVALVGGVLGFVFGAVVTAIANEPNRPHHPDAGAESVMNYVRGEGGGGGA